MIYLDNAATTFPKPPEVISAVTSVLSEHGGNPGRGGHRFSRLCADKIFECRENMARLINVSSPERIIFTKNATEAINTAIKGTAKKGDEIIISSMEHNSVLRSAVDMEKEGVTVKIVRADYKGRVSPEAVFSAVTPKTALICVTHASNVVGTVNPVEEICKKARALGILTLIDCAQTGGIFPIDASVMDMAAFAGHKGLFGPFGTGVLYIRNPLLPDTLTEGGTGSLSESALMPEILPDRFEAGTLNACGIAGLNEGIKFIMREGVFEKEQFLTKHLVSQLSAVRGLHVLGEPICGAVGMVFSSHDCIEIAARLDAEYDIATRAGLHCAPLAHRTLGTVSKGMLRLSPGFFNTTADIDMAVSAINNIISS